ncbi:MAG: ATP-binding protein [Elusimicrobiota bacterium]
MNAVPSDLNRTDAVWALKSEMALLKQRLDKMRQERAAALARTEAMEEEYRARFKMSLRQELERQRSSHEKFIEELGLNISHQVRNQLGIIQALAQSLSPKPWALRTQKAKDAIAASVHLVLTHLDEVTDFCRPVELHRQRAPVNGLLSQAMALIEERAAQAHIHIEFIPLTEPQELSMDGAQFGRAFLEILINAIEAMPSGGQLTLGACVRPDLSLVEIRISDTGRGVKPEHLKMLGHPFFTTKLSALGLGLAVAKRIIQAHYGELRFESSYGRGTTVKIRLAQ